MIWVLNNLHDIIYIQSASPHLIKQINKTTTMLSNYKTPNDIEWYWKYWCKNINVYLNMLNIERKKSFNYTYQDNLSCIESHRRVWRIHHRPPYNPDTYSAPGHSMYPGDSLACDSYISLVQPEQSDTLASASTR